MRVSLISSSWSSLLWYKKVIHYCMFVLYPSTLVGLFTKFKDPLAESLESSSYRIILRWKSLDFIFLFIAPLFLSFALSLPCNFQLLCWLSVTWINISVLFLILDKKFFYFFSFSMMLTIIHLWCILFIMSNYYPSIAIFFRAFIMKDDEFCEIFSAYI